MFTGLKNLRLSVKIAMLGAGSVLVTATALVLLALWQSNQYNSLAQSEVDKLITSDFNHVTEGVYNLVRTQHEAALERLNRPLKVSDEQAIAAHVRRRILSIKLGKTGYVYLLKGKGSNRGSYVISQKGERDGENIWETKDSDGRPVIKSIIAKAIALKPEEFASERYRWQNPGELQPRWKIAQLAYYEPLDWVIGSSAYEDELQTYKEVLNQGQNRLMKTLGIAGAIISLLIGLLGVALALTIARPIKQLKRGVETIIDGNLDQVLAVNATDEIGSLTQLFNIMTARLKETHEEIRQMVAGVVESEELLRLAEEISHVGSWSHDLATDKLSWSDEVFRIVGLEPQSIEPTYDAFLAMVHPEDRALVKSAYLESVAAGNSSYEIEHRIIREKSGEVRVVLERCFHVCDSAGQIIKSTGMVHDITERKQVEAALERRIMSLTRPLDENWSIDFEDLFNLSDIQRLQDEFAKATGVASIITYPDGTPITQPSGFCRLCIDIIRQTEKGLANCYKSDAMLGRLSHNGPAIQPCMSGGLWDAGAGISVGGRHIANWLIGQVRDETQTEERMREYAREIGADEQELIAAFREVPAMSQQQFEAVAGALFTLANQLSTTAYQNVQQARFIAERKQMETELHLLNSELEQRVAVRTAELERMNIELESFCYSISHEIRAPIARLAGFSSTIKEIADNPDPELLVYCAERIETASNRLRTVIDSLLTLNRLSRAEITLMPVNLSEIAVQVMNELLEDSSRRSIEQNICQGIVVLGDPDMLEICMRNLLGNAIKYTEKTQKAVVEFGQAGTGTEHVYFVRDNGAGFDMEGSKNLFVPFCRLHSVEEFEGIGIGLATVQRIIEKHGGKIWAEATPDKGATFFFTLKS
ncbi:PocR ligand-binding domain-containing protein [Geobacter pelophilus]|uniref:histidine kinase n=1 Tax=Geoanaerobacter pelophilus TaxID=60036 RepID=A0AAW4L0J2_9BACT|nr:PocR ligand-binding domain-containing protein [Geoanaerobacter pelophilus]MBT0664199.1 PocR ligand-binding domain-containing protein [Geoanaerobacter pelophilus]